MFSGYIPTSNLFSSNNLQYLRDPSRAIMKIQVFNLVGAPHTIKGLQEFRLQNTPEILNDPEVSAVYSEHTGLGLTRPTLHYTHGETGPIDIPFIISDAFEGPPHATRDFFGNLVVKDFENLFEVVSWLKALTSPVSEWKKPPFVRMSYGRWSQFGVLLSEKTDWISMYPNGTPRIGRVHLTLKPDVVVITDQKSFFEVGK